MTVDDNNRATTMEERIIVVEMLMVMEVCLDDYETI